MKKIHPDSIRYTRKAPAIDEYQQLYTTTGWPEMPDERVKTALLNSYCVLSAYCDDKMIGMVRVVGDSAMYFYIQDMVVSPDFQRLGIGREMMNLVLEFLKEHIDNNAFVGLMAAKHAQGFYRSFGFVERSDGEPGMYLKRK